MTHLEIGNKAPSFSAKNEKDEIVNLSDFKDRKLILFFYPRDDSPGCTKQACSLRDNFRRFQKMGIDVIGVSPDSVKKHQKFINKYEFQYSLLSDPDKEIINAYGVWGTKKFMGREIIGVHRTTFIINEEGTIEKIIKKVVTKTHGDQILEELKALESA
jgi:peroxiredoxin Q/BCP